MVLLTACQPEQIWRRQCCHCCSSPLWIWSIPPSSFLFEPNNAKCFVPCSLFTLVRFDFMIHNFCFFMLIWFPIFFFFDFSFLFESLDFFRFFFSFFSVFDTSNFSTFQFFNFFDIFDFFDFAILGTGLLCEVPAAVGRLLGDHQPPCRAGDHDAPLLLLDGGRRHLPALQQQGEPSWYYRFSFSCAENKDGKKKKRKKKMLFSMCFLSMYHFVPFLMNLFVTMETEYQV